MTSHRFADSTDGFPSPQHRLHHTLVCAFTTVPDRAQDQCQHCVVNLRITISLIVLAALIVGGYTAYRRYIASMQVGSEARQINGARLTSERLQQLPSPPWRFVLEISADRLGGVDQVMIGPCGIIAASTLMFGRPEDAETPDPQNMANAAVMRSPVDDLAERERDSRATSSPGCIGVHSSQNGLPRLTPARRPSRSKANASPTGFSRCHPDP